MKAVFSYAIASGLAVGLYLNTPASLQLVRPTWLDEFRGIADKAFAFAKPEVAAVAADPAGAALVDEELDYRIAERIGSVDGWRSYLAAHGNGAYAQSAGAEVERLLLDQKDPTRAVGQSANEASTDMTGSDRPTPASPAADAASPTQNETCRHDEDRPERPRSNPTSDNVARFKIGLGCEKLRPQLLALIGSSGYAALAPVDMEVSNGAFTDAKPAPSPALRIASPAHPKRRVLEPPIRTRWAATWHGFRAKRHASGCGRNASCFWRGQENLFAPNTAQFSILRTNFALARLGRRFE